MILLKVTKEAQVHKTSTLTVLKSAHAAKLNVISALKFLFRSIYILKCSAVY